MNVTYYTITYKGKKYCYESPVYGMKKVASRLNIDKKYISFGADTDLPLWPPHQKTLKELWKEIHPAFIWNGKIDTVVELRKENWIARAWGFVVGQVLLGIVIFYRR
jgi:hypothetical protein